MEIATLKLITAKPAEMQRFYTKTLGLPLLPCISAIRRAI